MAKEQAQKPEASQAPEHKKSAEPQKKGKEHTYLPGMCHAWGCKSHSHRLDFCDEHYDQFKFGLIKKTGEQVPDWEKKLEHYQAWKARRGAHKAA